MPRLTARLGEMELKKWREYDRKENLAMEGRDTNQKQRNMQINGNVKLYSYFSYGDTVDTDSSPTDTQ